MIFYLWSFLCITTLMAMVCSSCNTKSKKNNSQDSQNKHSDDKEPPKEIISPPSSQPTTDDDEESEKKIEDEEEEPALKTSSKSNAASSSQSPLLKGKKEPQSQRKGSSRSLRKAPRPRTPMVGSDRRKREVEDASLIAKQPHDPTERPERILAQGTTNGDGGYATLRDVLSDFSDTKSTDTSSASDVVDKRSKAKKVVPRKDVAKRRPVKKRATDDSDR